MHGVRARLIVEAANHPVMLAADAILQRRGIEVIPDIIANAGGVVVSYFEWTQNIQQFRWTEERVNDELSQRMLAAYREVAGGSRPRATSHSGKRPSPSPSSGSRRRSACADSFEQVLGARF